MQIDRRKEFKDVPWQQGRLLLTRQTERWSREDQEQADADERKRCFVNFTSFDLGKGRELIFIFDTAEECFDAVTKHNLKFKSLKSTILMTTQYKSL